MIRTAEEAVKAALATSFNEPGMCQAVTRGWFNAPSVGDFDGDGSPDAEDGWKSEPEWARVPGDKRPPRGAPVAWAGGSKDNGHRAISLGPIDGVWSIRSTDARGPGQTGTVPLGWVESEWNMTYLGWSKTISGQPIEGLMEENKPTPKPTPKKPSRVSKARDFLKSARKRALAKGNTKRARLIQKMLDVDLKR